MGHIWGTGSPSAPGTARVRKPELRRSQRLEDGQPTGLTDDLLLVKQVTQFVRPVVQCLSRRSTILAKFMRNYRRTMNIVRKLGGVFVRFVGELAIV